MPQANMHAGPQGPVKDLGASVEVQRLCKRYGTVQAVDEVSLRAAAGEFLTLLGPSGSGKTSTLMMIAGFETADSGEILIGDEVVTNVPPYRRNLGFVFQHYALFPHMTVAENLAFPLRIRGIDSNVVGERIASALELVMLPGLGDRMPSQLSGGQQQRVALARALIFDPPVLLMDEPLGALDKKLRQQMQFEIKKLQRDLNVTVIYVTHDQEEALTMSDRIAVMKSGQIAQVARPEDIYERPTDSFVADFIGEANLLSGTLRLGADGQASLHTDDGIVWPLGESHQVHESEARVTIALRPERLRVCGSPAQTDGDGPALPVGLDGTVEEAVYLGNLCKYVIRVGDTRLLSLALISAQQGRFQPGQQVHLHWREDDARVLG